MKKNQKGFSTVEILLVIIITGLVGFTGWFVWSNRSAKPANTQASSSTPSNTQTTATSPAANESDPSLKWTRITSENGKFSLLIPDGWKVLSTPSGRGDSIYVADALFYGVPDGTDLLKITEGQKPTVLIQNLNRGLISPFSAFVTTNATEAYTPEGTAKVIGTVGGKKVTRYENHPTESWADEAQPGDINYRYQFENTNFIVNYIHIKDTESHLADIEKIVRSVELKL